MSQLDTPSSSAGCGTTFARNCNCNLCEVIWPSCCKLLRLAHVCLQILSYSKVWLTYDRYVKHWLTYLGLQRLIANLVAAICCDMRRSYSAKASGPAFCRNSASRNWTPFSSVSQLHCLDMLGFHDLTGSSACWALGKKDYLVHMHIYLCSTATNRGWQSSMTFTNQISLHIDIVFRGSYLAM